MFCKRRRPGIILSKLFEMATARLSDLIFMLVKAIIHNSQSLKAPNIAENVPPNSN